MTPKPFELPPGSIEILKIQLALAPLNGEFVLAENTSINPEFIGTEYDDLFWEIMNLTRLRLKQKNHILIGKKTKRGDEK